jgi:uncharacterized membrane protein YfcA
MDWIVWVTLISAVVLFGISKGGFGGGLGVFSVPLMAMVISAPFAAAILLPLLLVMDVLILYQFWNQWDKRETFLITVAGVIGVGIGVLCFGILDENGLKVLLGIICLCFCGLWLIRKVRKTEDTTAPFNWIKGGIWGAIAGFTSFIAHAGGPPANIYLLPRKLDKSVYQASISLAFAVINLVKVLPFILLGSITWESLTLSLYLLPAGVIGVVIGFVAHHKLDEERFYTFIYICLILVGIRLLQDGFSGILGA